MNAAEIINQAAGDGVRLALSTLGKLKLAGCKEAVAHWQPVLVQHKAALLVALNNRDRVSHTDDFVSILPEKELLRNGMSLGNGPSSEAVTKKVNMRIKEFPPRKLEEVTQRYSPTVYSLRNIERPSPMALKWLLDNRVRLRLQGWSMAELFRRNKSRGICWCNLWDMPFLEVYLHDDGVIEFECVSNGRDIIQTARPMRRSRKI